MDFPFSSLSSDHIISDHLSPDHSTILVPRFRLLSPTDSLFASPTLSEMEGKSYLLDYVTNLYFSCC